MCSTRKRVAAEECGFARKQEKNSELIRILDLRLSAANYNLTYSKSNGLPLMPDAGGAIQFAILPTSVTGCIELPTYSRSAIVGSHSDFFCSDSSFVIRLPCRSKKCPAYSPTCR